RGAPSHWLGHIVAEDLDADVARWVSLGAMTLGPVRADAAGARIVKLRDAQGAVFALCSSSDPSADGAPIAAWHQLNTTDLEGAWAHYSAVFGWRAEAMFEVGGGVGVYQTFRWAEGSEIAGGMSAAARQ